MSTTVSPLESARTELASFGDRLVGPVDARYDEARTVLEESVAVNRGTSERLLEAHALAALADVSLQLGRALDARQLLTAALALREGLGDDAGTAELRRRLADLEAAAH